MTIRNGKASQGAIEGSNISSGLGILENGGHAGPARLSHRLCAMVKRAVTRVTDAGRFLADTLVAVHPFTPGESLERRVLLSTTLDAPGEFTFVDGGDSMVDVIALGDGTTASGVQVAVNVTDGGDANTADVVNLVITYDDGDTNSNSVADIEIFASGPINSITFNGSAGDTINLSVTIDDVTYSTDSGNDLTVNGVEVVSDGTYVEDDGASDDGDNFQGTEPGDDTVLAADDAGIGNTAINVSGGFVGGNITLETVGGNVGLLTINNGVALTGTANIDLLAVNGDAAGITISGNVAIGDEVLNLDIEEDATAGADPNVSIGSGSTITIGDGVINVESDQSASINNLSLGSIEITGEGDVNLASDDLGTLAIGGIALSGDGSALNVNVAGDVASDINIGDIDLEANGDVTIDVDGDAADVFLGNVTVAETSYDATVTVNLGSADDDTAGNIAVGDVTMDYGGDVDINVAGTAGNIGFGDVTFNEDAYGSSITVDVDGDGLTTGTPGVEGSIAFGDVTINSDDSNIEINIDGDDTTAGDDGVTNVGFGSFSLNGDGSGAIINVFDAISGTVTVGDVTFGDDAFGGLRITAGEGGMNAVNVGDVDFLGETEGQLEFYSAGDIDDVTINSVDHSNLSDGEIDIVADAGFSTDDGSFSIDGVGTVGNLTITNAGDDAANETVWSEGSDFTGAGTSTTGGVVLTLPGDVWGRLYLLQPDDAANVEASFAPVVIGNETVGGHFGGWLIAPDGIDSLTVWGGISGALVNANSDADSEGDLDNADSSLNVNGALGNVLVHGMNIDEVDGDGLTGFFSAADFADVTVMRGNFGAFFQTNAELDTEEDQDAHIGNLGNVDIQAGGFIGESVLNIDDGIGLIFAQGPTGDEALANDIGGFEDEAGLDIDADYDENEIGGIVGIDIIDGDGEYGEAFYLDIYTGGLGDDGEDRIDGLGHLNFHAGLDDDLYLHLHSEGDVGPISVGAATGLTAQTGSNDLRLTDEGIVVHGTNNDGLDDDEQVEAEHNRDLAGIYVGTTLDEPLVVTDNDSDLIQVDEDADIRAYGNIGEILVGDTIAGIQGEDFEIEADSNESGVGGDIQRVLAGVGGDDSVDGSSIFNTTIIAPGATATGDGILLQVRSDDSTGDDLTDFTVASTNTAATAHVEISFGMDRTPHLNVFELQNVGASHDFIFSSRLADTTTTGFDGEDVFAAARFTYIEVDDADTVFDTGSNPPDADFVDDELTPREVSFDELILEAEGDYGAQIDVNNGVEPSPNGLGVINLLSVQQGFQVELDIDAENIIGLVLGGDSDIADVNFNISPAIEVQATQRTEPVILEVIDGNGTSFFFRSQAFADARNDALPGDPILNMLFDSEVRVTPKNGDENALVVISANDATGGFAVNGANVYGDPVLDANGAISGFALGTVTVTGDDPGLEFTTSVAEIIGHTDISFIEAAGSIGSIQMIDDPATLDVVESPDLGSVYIGYWLGNEGGADGVENIRWNASANPTGDESDFVRDRSIVAPGFDLAYDTDPMGILNDHVIEGGDASLGFVRIEGEWVPLNYGSGWVQVTGSILGNVDVVLAENSERFDADLDMFIRVGDNIEGDWTVQGDWTGSIYAGMLKINSDDMIARGEDGLFFGGVADNVDEGGVAATTGYNSSLVINGVDHLLAEGYPEDQVESALEYYNSAFSSEFALADWRDLYTGSIMAADGSAVTFTIIDADGDATVSTPQEFSPNLIVANDIALNIDSVNGIGNNGNDDAGMHIAAITGNIGLADVATLWHTHDEQTAVVDGAGSSPSNIDIEAIYAGGSFYTDLNAGIDAGSTSADDAAEIEIDTLEIDGSFGRAGEGTTVWRADGDIDIDYVDIGLNDAAGTRFGAFMVGDSDEPEESWLVTLLAGLELGFDPSDGVSLEEVTAAGLAETNGDIDIELILIDDNFGAVGQDVSNGLIASGDVNLGNSDYGDGVYVGGVAREGWDEGTGVSGYAASLENDPSMEIDAGGSFLVNVIAGVTNGRYGDGLVAPQRSNVDFDGVLAIDDDFGQAINGGASNVISASGNVFIDDIFVGVSFTTYSDASNVNGTIDLNGDGDPDAFVDVNGDGVVDVNDAFRSVGDMNVDIVAGYLADNATNRDAGLIFQPVFGNVNTSGSGVPGGGLPQLANVNASVVIDDLNVGVALMIDGQILGPIGIDPEDLEPGDVAIFFPDDPNTAAFEGPGNVNGIVIAARDLTVAEAFIAGNLIGGDGAGGHAFIAGAGYIGSFGDGSVLSLGGENPITVVGDTIANFAAGRFVPLHDTGSNPLDPNDQATPLPTDVELRAGTVLTLASASINLTTGRLRGELNGSVGENGITLDEVLSGTESLADSAYYGRTTFSATDNLELDIEVEGRPYTADQLVLNGDLIEGDLAGTLGNTADGDATGISILAFGDIEGYIDTQDQFLANFILGNVDAITAINTQSPGSPVNPSKGTVGTAEALNSSGGDIDLSIESGGMGVGGIDIAYFLAGFDVFTRINAAGGPGANAGAPVTATSTTPQTPDFWASFGSGDIDGEVNAFDGNPTNGFNAGVLSFALIAAGNDISADLYADGDIVGRLGSATTDGSAWIPGGLDADILAGADVVSSVDPLGEFAFGGGDLKGDIVAGDDIRSADEDTFLSIAAAGSRAFDGDAETPGRGGDISGSIVAGVNVQIDGPDILGLGNDEVSGISALIIASDVIRSEVIEGDFFTGGLHTGAGLDLDINTVDDNPTFINEDTGEVERGHWNSEFEIFGDVDVTAFGILVAGNLKGHFHVHGDFLGDLVVGGDVTGEIIIEGDAGLAEGDSTILIVGSLYSFIVDGTLFSDFLVGGSANIFEFGEVADGTTIILGLGGTETNNYVMPDGSGTINVTDGTGVFFFVAGQEGGDVIVYLSGSGVDLMAAGVGLGGLDIRQIVSADDLGNVSITNGSLGQLVVSDDYQIAAVLESQIELFSQFAEGFGFVVLPSVEDLELEGTFNDSAEPANLVGNVYVEGNIGIEAPDEFLIPSGDVSIGQGLNDLDGEFPSDNVAIYVQGVISGDVISTAGSIGNVVADDLIDADFTARESIGDVAAINGDIDYGDSFTAELGDLGVLYAHGHIDSPSIDVTGDVGGFIAETGYIDDVHVYTHGSIGFFHASGDIYGVELYSETGTVGYDLDTEDRWDIGAAGFHSLIGDIEELFIVANGGVEIDPITLEYVNTGTGDVLSGVNSIFAELGDIEADITTGGSIGIVDPESGQVVGGIAAPLGEVDVTLKVGGHVGGLSGGMGVDLDASSVILGTIGLIRNAEDTSGASVGGVTAANPLVIVGEDGVDYRVIVSSGSASVTYSIQGGEVVFDSINYTPDADDEEASLQVLTTHGGRNADGTFTDAVGIQTRVDDLIVHGDLASLAIEGTLGTAEIEGDLGTSTTAPSVTIEGGRFDALTTGGTNFGLQEIRFGVFRNASGQVVVNRTVAIANPNATGEHDQYFNIMLYEGSGTVVVNNGYIEAINLDGRSIGLSVAAHDEAIEGETAASLRDALAAAQDGKGHVRLGEVNLNGSALGNAIFEGDVALISAQSNRSVLNTIHIDGDLGELRSSGSLANLFVGGDAERIDGGIALANVDVEGDVDVIQATRAIRGVTVGGDLGRLVASGGHDGSGGIADVFIGGNAGSIATGGTMLDVSVNGSVVNLSATRMASVSVLGSVGVQITADGELLTLGGIHGADGFTLLDVARALGVAEFGGGDYYSSDELGEILYHLADQGLDSWLLSHDDCEIGEEPRFLGGISAGVLRGVAVGGLISDLLVSGQSFDGNLFNQTVDDAYVFGVTADGQGMLARGYFIQVNGTVQQFGGYDLMPVADKVVDVNLGSITGV